MLCAGGDDINTSCVYIGVSEDIRQLCNILFDTIKGSCKQMSEVMWEHLFRRNTGLLTQFLHLPPYITAVKRFAVFGYKQYAGSNSLFHRIPKQLLLQSLDNKYFSCLALTGNNCLTSPDSLHRNTLQLTDANARPADCLHHKGQTFVFLLLSSSDKRRVFCFAKLLFFGAIGFLLHLAP